MDITYSDFSFSSMLIDNNLNEQKDICHDKASNCFFEDEKLNYFGYTLNDGTIFDINHNYGGYINEIGLIYNKFEKLKGYIISSGKIFDKDNKFIGCLKGTSIFFEKPELYII